MQFRPNTKLPTLPPPHVWWPQCTSCDATSLQCKLSFKLSFKIMTAMFLRRVMFALWSSGPQNKRSLLMWSFRLLVRKSKVWILSTLESSHTDHVEIIRDNCDIGFHLLSNIPIYLFYAQEFAKKISSRQICDTPCHLPRERLETEEASEYKFQVEVEIVLDRLLVSLLTFTFWRIVSKQGWAQCSLEK